MKLARLSILSLSIATAVGAACTAGDATFSDDDQAPLSTANTGVGGQGGAGGDITTTGGGDDSTGSFNPTTVGNGGGTGTPCESGDTEDQDQDGYTKLDGDCNDCDPNVNPGAIEVATDPNDEEADPADENCDGEIDEPPILCDDGIDIADINALEAAKAIDICHTVTDDGFGLVGAAYVRANGTQTTPSMNVGVLDGFGPNVPPRLGNRMVGLSSGHARDNAGDPNPCGALTCSLVGPGTPPAGFPQDVPSCPGGTNINDDVGLEVTLRAPTNATGYSFDFDFYSFEYPEWVCTTYNDQFIALVTPPPAAAINGNISFDSMNNPVSVNIAFFEVCSGCSLGTGELTGTGFDTWNDAGATSWLVTQAPIGPGEEFSIRFAIWDTGDTAYDSTVLIDNFQWLATAGTVTVGTNPVPN